METIWKAFRLDELFEFSSSNQLSANKKNLDISPEKDETHTIALITQTEKNNGIVGYLETNAEIESKKMINALTYSMHFGLCFYHTYDFVLMDTHGSVFRLIPKNSHLKETMDSFGYVNSFLGHVITKVCRNGIYNYGWLPNSGRVGREIIMLPLSIDDSATKSLTNVNGRKAILDLSTIHSIMLTVKKNKETRTIDFYKKKKSYFDSLAEKRLQAVDQEKKIYWLSFKLGELFDRDTSRALKTNQKDLNLTEEKDEFHKVALISASSTGSGRVGYLNDGDYPVEKVGKGKLTFDDQWGFTYFQDEDFIITGGHNAVLELKNNYLKKELDKDPDLYKFVSNIINKITIKSSIFGFGYKINNKMDREIILLPFVEADSGAYMLRGGKKYSLASQKMLYWYAKGKANLYQNRINNYKSYIGGSGDESLL